MRITYVSWASDCSRSDNTARELGGASHMVYLARLGSTPWTVAFKYLGQCWMTLRILLRERPDATFVMVPPPVAALLVYAYSRITGSRFVMDAHTAAFLHPRWRRLQWLQRALCRRAATTIVTNEHLAEVVKHAGASATIVRDVPVVFPGGGRFQPEGEFTVAVVCSFNYDEPVREMLEAARALEAEGFRFYVTGNTKHADGELVANRPGNVEFTGFLALADYGRLLTRAHAVLTLTTRDHTMLRGAYEAIYQGTPVVVSDWPILRRSFDSGALHVDNTTDGIVAALRALKAEWPRYKAGAARLREKKLEEWRAARQQLLDRVTHA